jgi:hypothetical protein
MRGCFWERFLGFCELILWGVFRGSFCGSRGILWEWRFLWKRGSERWEFLKEKILKGSFEGNNFDSWDFWERDFVGERFLGIF